MDNLKTTTALVKEVLENDKKSRNSDNYLYLQILKIIGRDNGIDIDSMSIPMFLLNIKEYGFPQFESVRRTRQKLQAAHPELAGDAAVEYQRARNEEVFRAYSRGCV